MQSSRCFCVPSFDLANSVIIFALFYVQGTVFISQAVSINRLGTFLRANKLKETPAFEAESIHLSPKQAPALAEAKQLQGRKL